MVKVTENGEIYSIDGNIISPKRFSEHQLMISEMICGMQQLVDKIKSTFIDNSDLIALDDKFDNELLSQDDLDFLREAHSIERNIIVEINGSDNGK